ncbi:hypothetical protein F0L74_01325 [Chitinophaga agrisoli]|uniref:Uncharacterized protein n=1 Tax=Chitinophaga agrisoli TaxID=2607653 RepID=A0A5B2W0N0_9BACT|nr:hypothetical protein [Chitinophaga agrisoli]KAA2244644.1 hypothetical protein F0L74_01325 [Chitinophaga agrisoli]
MKQHWFKKQGWIYIPTSIPGSLLTIFALVLVGWCCWTIDRSTRSLPDALIHFFGYFTCVAFWWKWIAEKTAQKNNES